MKKGLGEGEIRGLGGGGGLGMDYVWFKYTFYMVKIDTTFYAECRLCIRSVDLDVDLDA